MILCGRAGNAGMGMPVKQHYGWDTPIFFEQVRVYVPTTCQSQLRKDFFIIHLIKLTMPDDVWAQGFLSFLVINNMSNAMSKNAHFQGD